MKKITRILAAVYTAILSIIIIFLGGTFAYADQVNDIRNFLKEWIAVEKNISREKENWRQEKELLNGILSSLDQEERVLRETIEAAEQDSSRADEERLELISRREAYQQSSNRFREKLVLFERQAAQLIPRLPTLLRDEIGLMTNRLYLAETGNYSLSERAQNLINLLSAIQEFDSSITVANEIRQIQNGEEIAVKVLYLGLSRAFFADQANRVAGIGLPVQGGSDDGWQWIEQIDLSGDINRAIEIYENNSVPELVQLPLSVHSN